MHKEIIFKIILCSFFFLHSFFLLNSQILVGDVLLSTHPEDKNYGWDVALSEDGKTLAISDDSSSELTFYNGKIEVYHLSNDQWVAKGNPISIPVENASTGMRIQLSQDGEKLMFSLGYPYAKGLDIPRIYVYEFKNESWIPYGNQFTSTAGIRYDFWSVSLSGNGTRFAFASNIQGQSKSVSVYEIINDQWQMVGFPITTNEVSEGVYSNILSYSGDTIAIGLPNYIANSVVKGGFVVFALNNNAKWEQIGKVVSGLDSEDSLGEQIDISSDGKRIIASGSTNSPNFNEKAIVFELDQSNNYVQLGQNINQRLQNVDFGNEVSITNNGDRIAISAPKNWVDKILVSGSTYIYDWNGIEWKKMGFDIDGDENYERSGLSISLSGDGNFIAVGSPDYTLEGPGKGRVRVFNLEELVNTKSPKNLDSTITLSPNPTNGPLEIIGDGFYNIELYNYVGRLLLTNLESNKIDLAGLNNGIYFLKIEKDGRSVVKKVIKN